MPGPLELSVLAGPCSGGVLVLGRTRAVLGRAAACDLVLEDPGVSRRHAALEPAGTAGWRVRDLASTNGTVLDGVPVEPPGLPVRAGAVLRLGDSIVRIARRGEDDSAAGTDPVRLLRAVLAGTLPDRGSAIVQLGRAHDGAPVRHDLAVRPLALLAPAPAVGGALRWLTAQLQVAGLRWAVVVDPADPRADPRRPAARRGPLIAAGAAAHRIAHLSAAAAPVDGTGTRFVLDGGPEFVLDGVGDHWWRTVRRALPAARTQRYSSSSSGPIS